MEEDRITRLYGYVAHVVEEFSNLLKELEPLVPEEDRLRAREKAKAEQNQQVPRLRGLNRKFEEGNSAWPGSAP